MAISGKLNTIFGLQVFQFLRFLLFWIVSIVITKFNLPLKEISDWEIFIFISGALSYFWVTGIIQSFLPLYKRNLAFIQHHRTPGKSPELFNAFLLLCAFSLIFVALILFSAQNFAIFWRGTGELPYPKLLALYFFTSNTTPLVEYIYLLNNAPRKLLRYGYLFFLLQLAAVCIPLTYGYGVEAALWGLIGVTILRFLWLIRLLVKYAEFKISIPFIQNHLYVGYPIIISTLLSGSAQYIDGIIASIAFTPERFAIFRYGCKELPFVVVMTTALNNALIPTFSIKRDIPFILSEIKRRSLRQMHILFPVSMLVMIFSDFLFRKIMFNDSFDGSADIFMVYQLMIISRIVYPQTILLGLKKNTILMKAAILEVFLHLGTSLIFVQFYGATGIPLGSGLVHIVEKFVLIYYVYRQLGIHPNKYIPIRWYVFYSILIILVFILIDHRIIHII